MSNKPMPKQIRSSVLKAVVSGIKNSATTTANANAKGASKTKDSPSVPSFLAKAPTHKGYPILAFQSQPLWRKWLSAHHTAVPNGIFLQIYKKKSGVPTVTYAEALDEALCFGWIDSVKCSYGDDGKSFVQRFSPRRAKGSIWSQVNQQHVARLISEGKMAAAGLDAIEVAKQNGQWAKAYPPVRKNGGTLGKGQDKSTR